MRAPKNMRKIVGKVITSLPSYPIGIKRLVDPVDDPKLQSLYPEQRGRTTVMEMVLKSDFRFLIEIDWGRERLWVTDEKGNHIGRYGSWKITTGDIVTEWRFLRYLNRVLLHHLEGLLAEYRRTQKQKK